MPATVSSSTVEVTTVFTDTERLALGGFLAGHSGQTRDAYTLDLRKYATWCTSHGLRLFDARRLCTVAGFYRYAVEEELLDHSPAVHVRRPRLDYESHAVGLDRYEVGAMLVAAGLGGPAEHALISLLALNGLRVSEACGADIEALALERGIPPEHCRRSVAVEIRRAAASGQADRVIGARYRCSSPGWSVRGARSFRSGPTARNSMCRCGGPSTRT